MRIPIYRSRDENTPKAWWEWLFLLIVAPVLIMRLIIQEALTVLILWRREQHYMRSMKEGGRFIPWKDLEPRLQVGEGTLMVEQAHKIGNRLWWTPDDVMHEASIQAPTLMISTSYYCVPGFLIRSYLGATNNTSTRTRARGG